MQISIQEQSLSYIDSHYSVIMSDESPDDLLNTWVYQGKQNYTPYLLDIEKYYEFIMAEVDQNDTTFIPLKIFFYTWGRYAIFNGTDSADPENCKANLLMFELMQYCLQCTQSIRKHHLKMPRINLFDFDRYDDVLMAFDCYKTGRSDEQEKQFNDRLNWIIENAGKLCQSAKPQS